MRVECNCICITKTTLLGLCSVVSGSLKKLSLREGTQTHSEAVKKEKSFFGSQKVQKVLGRSSSKRKVHVLSTTEATFRRTF